MSNNGKLKKKLSNKEKDAFADSLTGAISNLLIQITAIDQRLIALEEQQDKKKSIFRF